MQKIEVTTGNIFDASTQAITNPVNCVGVMGAGLALQFKNKFPDNYRAYVLACRNRLIEPGKVFSYNTGEYYIVNFPTKRHWKDKSHIEDIKSGLVDLVRVVKDNNISSIAIPPLGCGLGGLDWHREVLPLINEYLGDVSLNTRIVLYQP